MAESITRHYAAEKGPVCTPLVQHRHHDRLRPSFPPTDVGQNGLLTYCVECSQAFVRFGSR